MPSFAALLAWVLFREAYLCQTLASYGVGVPTAVALVVLFVGEQLQHSYELHAMKNLSWSSQFFKFNTAIISALETAGGAGLLLSIHNPHWFAFAGEHQVTVAYAVGGLAMLAGLGVEHVVEGQSLSPDAPG